VNRRAARARPCQRQKRRRARGGSQSTAATATTGRRCGRPATAAPPSTGQLRCGGLGQHEERCPGRLCRKGQAKGGLRRPHVAGRQEAAADEHQQEGQGDLARPRHRGIQCKQERAWQRAHRPVPRHSRLMQHKSDTASFCATNLPMWRSAGAPEPDQHRQLHHCVLQRAAPARARADDIFLAAGALHCLRAPCCSCIGGRSAVAGHPARCLATRNSVLVHARHRSPRNSSQPGRQTRCSCNLHDKSDYFVEERAGHHLAGEVPPRHKLP